MNWAYVDPTLTITLDWGEAMDQTVEPAETEFALDVDGVAKPLDTFSWATATQCLLTYDEAILGPTVVSLRYQTSSPLFISLAGEIVTPFDLPVAAP